MDDEKSMKYPGDRMVLRGSMRLVLRPRCEVGDERPVLLGTHWKTYYVATPEFSSDVLVLDETMHLCRSKKVRELVAAAHRWYEGRKMVLDSIAYHEALPEGDGRRGRLAGLRERLDAGDAAKPAELAAVDYKVSSVPSLSVEEATKQREKFK